MTEDLVEFGIFKYNIASDTHEVVEHMMHWRTRLLGTYFVSVELMDQAIYAICILY